MKALQIATDLFQLWNDSNVVYCHWKSNEHLLEGLIGKTDLDVLVSPNCIDEARSILCKLEYKCMKSQYGSNYSGVEDWIGYDKATGGMIHIHLHLRMATGHRGLKEYSLPWAEIVLSERILSDRHEVYICPPDYELIILYTRIGLKANLRKSIKAYIGKYHISRDEKREIEYLQKRVNCARVHEIISGQYGKDTDKLFEIIKSAYLNSCDFLRLKRIASSHMKKYRIESGIKLVFDRLKYGVLVPVRNVIKMKLGILLVTKKTLGEDSGVSIAFMGQDGAGKSTVTNEIKNWLSWKLDVRKVYLGSGDHYFSWRKKLICLLKRSSLGPANVLRGLLSVQDSKALSKKVYRSIKKAEKYKNKGGIVLYDRYPQIQFFGINDGPKIREKCKKYLSIPIIGQYMKHCADIEESYLKKASEIAPDLVFKLILRPEVSIQRKPQEQLENVRRKHEIIKAVEFSESEVTTIDAEMGYDLELIEIKSKIWQMIMRNSAEDSEPLINCKK